MDPSTALALAQLAIKAGPPLIDLLSGRSRRIAQQQGRPFSISDVFFGAPELREPFMEEGSKQYSQMLKSMGPFAQQLFSGSPDAFSPLYQQAMQQFQTQTAPAIANAFGSYGGTRYAGAMPQAMAQAGRMLQTDLAGQQMNAQMNLLQTLLGGMPGMRGVGQQQQARPGLFTLLSAPGESGGRSPLEQIAMSGINALFPSGPSAQQRAAANANLVDTSGFGKTTFGPAMPSYGGGFVH